MIEIKNVRQINKGVLVASCDVYIAPWHLTLHEVKIFEQGDKRWISLPTKEVVDPTGVKKYFPLVSFDTEELKNRLRDQVMGAFDKLSTSAPVDVFKAGQDLPF